MNVLTKAFVVLVAVMAVMLMALVVSFAANTENYRERNEELKTQLAAAETKARSAQIEITAANERLSTTINQQVAQINQLMADKAEGLAQISELKSQLVDSQREITRVNADFANLTTTANQNAKLLEVTLDEVKQLRTDKLALESQNIQFQNRNNELQSRHDALERALRRANEQVVALQDQNRQLEERIAKVPTAQLASNELKPISATPITGRIVRLKTDGPATFAELNVGSRDGVKENMEFLVHRGEKFLGKLVVEAVDVNAAAGSIVMVAPGANITGGEAVYHGAN